MVSRDEALGIAETFLGAEIQPQAVEELQVVGLEEFPTCWVAVYNTRKFAESGHIRHSLAGNSPLFINKRTKAARTGLTGVAIEDQLDPS